jgi:FkbM family methyltransferase
LKALWSNLLKISAFRRAMLAHLRLDYFHEFHHSIPLGNNYWAHLWENDAYDSFSEIFIQQEYADFIPDENIINILDLGAHYGYFSLWLQSKRPQDEIHSLMVEPAQRCKRSLEKMVQDPKLGGRFQYLQAAVGNPKEESTRFFERPFMGGSLFASSSADYGCEVKTLALPGEPNFQKQSFDLIKCDLEGAEWDFIIHYSSLLKNSKFLVMEWHSWHQGDGGFPQIEKKLSDIGFKIIKSSSTQKAVGREGEVGLFIAKNLNFQN